MTAMDNLQQYELIFNHYQGYLALLSPQGEILKINQETLELQEKSVSEVQGQHIGVLAKNELELALLSQSLKTVNDSGESTQLELTRKTSPETSHINLSFTALKDNSGTISNILLQGQSISDDQFSQEQLADKQKLISEETLLRSILDKTADGILVLNPEGQILFKNSVYEEIFAINHFPQIIDGYTVGDIFNFYDLDSDTLLSLEERPFWLALNGKEISNYEEVVKLKNTLPEEFASIRELFGKSKTISVSARAVKNANNTVSSVVLSITDITSIRAMQAKAILERQIRLAFENTFVGVAVLNEKGIISQANPAFSNMLGYNEVDGLPFQGFTYPRNLSLEQFLLGDETSDTNTTYIEKQLRHENGSIVDVMLTKSVSYNDNNGVQNTIIHFLDVTENNRLTAALDESQQNYKSIFNSQLDSVIVTNISGKIININPSAIDLLGYSSQEIVGEDFWTLFSTQAQEDKLAVFNAFCDNDRERLHTDSISYLRKDGQNFAAETVRFSVYHNNGQRLGYTWIIQDISQRKSAEIALTRFNQRLAASREEERRRLARELHDGIVQDLIGFSYELANIESQYVDETYSVEIKHIRNSLTQSIKQLRIFISDLRPVGIEEFGFKSALESYIALLERDKQDVIAFPEIQQNVLTTTDLPLPVNLCLFRTAQEALTNITKHAKATNVTIELTSIDLPEGQHLELKIQDDGIGFVPPDNLHVFAQAQSFGLVGINERVDLVDGHFFLDSKAGEGTTLKIQVPYEPGAVSTVS